MSDIALLLLIFFIVTTQFLVQRSLRGELPSITSDRDQASEDLIQVVVEEEWVFLDGDRMKLEELAVALAPRLANKATAEERAVVLDGQSTVAFERVAGAANEIKRAGGMITLMKVEE